MSADDPEVVVRQRADGATELRVGGVFVMDDVETTSERLLAEHTVAAGAREVLVGGLGLGYSAHTLLESGATRVVVAELHQAVADAVAGGAGAGPLNDPRLQVVIADVRDVVAAQPAKSLDAVCLDVDNGPDFLVHPQNAAVYGEEFLRQCARCLRPGGLLIIWSMADSPTLRRRMSTVLERVRAIEVPVTLQNRAETYWLLCGQVPAISSAP